MQPAPKRPRPRPRPGTRHPAHAAAAGEGMRAPGLAALLRRRPELRRPAAVAAIAGGVALFVVASLTNSLASADVAHRPPPTSAPTADPPLPTTLASPPAQKVLTSKPVHAKSAAPANRGVISGLAANGIPKVALNAYRVAAARLGNADPGCGVDWALLAGIGREESNHGQYGGAVLHANGDDVPHVIGPALDGVHWAYIPAPANGRALDGDATYAHALGPMQFIPSTWAIYGTDGNGDHKADVFNIYDAALGAARYLCAAGGNLRSHAGQVRAVLAYNHSDQYVAQVLALADAYRRGIPITGIPVGITSGPLPALHHHGAPPPANPGPPTAVSHDKKAAAKPTPSATKSTSPSGTRSTTGGAPTGGTSTPPAGGTSGGSTSAPPTAGSGSSQPAPPPPTAPPPSTPTPTPSPTCKLWLLGQCVIPG